MSFLFSESVKSQFSGCVCCSCETSDCKLKFDGFPGEKVIIDVDCAVKPQASGRRCDYVVVADAGGETFFLPVEFKAVNLNPKKIKQQLEGGIEFFKQYLPENFKCYPVIVSKKLRQQDRKNLTNIRIKWNESKTRVRHVRCNQSLYWDKVKKQYSG